MKSTLSATLAQTGMTMTMNKIKHVIIDADILTYRCGFACKDDEPVENALHSVKLYIQNILDKFPEHETFQLYLTGKDNFRYKVATIKEYKGNRKDTPKPKYYNEIRDYMIKVWKAQVIDGMEADDAMGIRQWSNPDRSTVIASIDKDLKQIPGFHYDFVKDNLYDISLPEANRMLFWQMLVGDTSDNIPGINKIGPKTADKLLPLEDGEEAWQRTVVTKYKEQYGSTWKDAFNEVATLLWMKRKEDKGCDFLIY